MLIPFSKPATSIGRQVDLLAERGMIISDRAFAELCLRHFNYYRLAAYWLPFEADHASHTFRAGTTFERVVELYRFDRELRLLVLDAIETIEVSVRSNFSHHVGLIHGPHAHLQQSFFLDRRKWTESVADLEAEVSRSNEVFVEHFREKYQERLPPIWASCEVMTLGKLSKWYKNLAPMGTRSAISKTYFIDQKVLESWLHHLSYVRNICAHHSRLWNRDFTVTPRVPRSKPMQLKSTMKSEGRGVYNTIVILDHFLGVIHPSNDWKVRVAGLVDRYDIPIELMDFPDWGVDFLNVS